MDELRARDPEMTKPVLVFDQQRSGRETVLMTGALDETFAGLVEANRATRTPAPLSALTVGLKCGGSDGFSGISANPAIGYISDLLGGAGRQDNSVASFPSCTAWSRNSSTAAPPTSLPSASTTSCRPTPRAPRQCIQALR